MIILEHLNPKKLYLVTLNQKGIKKVLLTAPGTEIPNIVYGINNKEVNVDEIDIFSAASCTKQIVLPLFLKL